MDPAAVQSPVDLKKRQVAFISDHIDITPSQFSDNYAKTLDNAIHRGDSFVL
ncbi:uncharacterized protein BDR25DRAFT_305633 [Lindgomyces ingoldianus]|uniref:Uncharacterized protein n=1 Tax=Lindgomyces ingoldianus TaxID=673940 RepID=A0ACB6QKY7_9PLEO|nr:uncharacterized protein BDR25DRAFT_305633 [Lindgomyces ingoldianus]KAF2467185.1 hypothetical protein BDR25DRAFT_305633 [Lindgomyces ingoldianus]